MTSRAIRIRRCRAQAAIDAHAACSGITDAEDTLIDLLADLRHWAIGKRYEFDTCLEISEINFDAETGGAS